MSILNSGTKSLAGSLSAALLACLSLAGCNALYSSSAVPHSMFSSGQVPVVYAVTSDGSVASASIDHSKEGIVLSVSLDEAVLPQVWGEVASDALFGTAVTKSDAAQFLASGSDYYALTVNIGSVAAPKLLTAGLQGGDVVYTGSSVPQLPDANLASDAQKIYYDAVASGASFVATDSAGTTALVTVPASGVLKSSLDSTWKAGRDAAVAFLLTPGRMLNGTASLTPEVSGSTWKLGPDDTGIPSSWAFDEYWPLLTKAFQATASTPTDGNTGATSE